MMRVICKDAKLEFNSVDVLYAMEIMVSHHLSVSFSFIDRCIVDMDEWDEPANMYINWMSVVLLD